MPATFTARKSHGPNGKVAYDLFRDGEFFAVIGVGRDEEWCFTDLNDERRGYRVRALLTRRLGRNKELRDMLPIIRQHYEGAR